LHVDVRGETSINKLNNIAKFSLAPLMMMSLMMMMMSLSMMSKETLIPKRTIILWKNSALT
jgi:hypothetical protein